MVEVHPQLVARFASCPATKDDHRACSVVANLIVGYRRVPVTRLRARRQLRIFAAGPAHTAAQARSGKVSVMHSIEPPVPVMAAENIDTAVVLHQGVTYPWLWHAALLRNGAHDSIRELERDQIVLRWH